MNYKLFDKRAICALRQLQNAGYGSWFVGGCVRDFIIGKKINDYDLATISTPEVIIKIFKNYEIDQNALSYGCVRINYQDLWLEITTLREDIQQNGRHSQVIFTTDLSKDAQRRDFTINALYWNGEKNSPIIDFSNGQSDLYSKNVCFIGSAEIRVQEDYLRILRFFRFSAIYGSSLNKDSFNACIKHQQGLAYLSGNRVWYEWSKTLLNANTAGVLKYICEYGIDITLFGGLLNLKASTNYQGNDPLLYTNLLLPTVHIKHLTHRLNLTKAQDMWLEVAESIIFEQDFRKLYLKYGEAAKELVYFWAAKFSTSAKTEFSKPFWQVLEPIFPLTGKDLLKLGCLPGTIVGSYLKNTQNWWVQNNFVPNYKECLEYANSLFKQ